MRLQLDQENQNRIRRIRRLLGWLLAAIAQVAIVFAIANGWVALMATVAHAQQAQALSPAEAASAAMASAKAIGTQQAQSDGQAVRNGQSEAVIANTVPGYTTNPPEKQYYTNNDTATPTAAMQARCAANPSDATCSATKIATASRPASGLNASSPVLAGADAARNPTSVLGDIANTYNACSVGGQMTTPAQWQRLTCTVDTGAWQTETCTKSLAADTLSCVPGSVLATATLGSGSDTMTVTAYCPEGGGTNIPFRFEATGGHGSCSGPLEAKLDVSQIQPLEGAVPAKVGTVYPHWGGSCFPLGVFWESGGCTNGQCAVNVHFAEEPGIVSMASCNQPGQVAGTDIIWSGTVPSNAANACYIAYTDAGEANGMMGYYGILLGYSAYWVEDAAGSGWQWTSGRHYQADLALEKPVFVQASGDEWASTCDSQEARTPKLPRDGINNFTGTAMPVVGQSGQPQCVRTASVCTDGPSTKLINGVPVTRDCWAYSNTFQCTTVAATSTCTSPQFATCSLSDQSTCLQTDELGRCIQAQLGYDCKTADAVFSQSLNCGNASYCAGGSCWDSSSTANTSYAYSAAQLDAHFEAAKDMSIDGDNIQIFKGQDRRCNINLFGIDNCCTDSAYITKCSSDEQETYQKKSAGKCHEIGDYCSSRTVLGICRKRTRTSCCFSSLLARVVQEQGRPQLGLSWGDAQNPQCRGFTPDELTAMDWSLFDLSEFYASINPSPLDQGQTTSGVAAQQSSCYYGNGKC